MQASRLHLFVVQIMDPILSFVQNDLSYQHQDCIFMSSRFWIPFFHLYKETYLTSIKIVFLCHPDSGFHSFICTKRPILPASILHFFLVHILDPILSFVQNDLSYQHQDCISLSSKFWIPFFHFASRR